jgi:hypothetical protein
MARATGLEPATSGVTGRRSNQLSYARKENSAPSRARLDEPEIRDEGPQVKGPEGIQLHYTATTKPSSGARQSAELERSPRECETPIGTRARGSNTPPRT